MSDRLFRRGAIYHCWYYDAHGEQQRKSTGCTSRRAAETVLKRFEEEARAQADGTTHKTATAALREVVDAYLTAAEKSERAEKTMDSYYCKGGHVLRVLGQDTDVNALPNSVEDDYIEARRHEGASDHTIHKELVNGHQDP